MRFALSSVVIALAACLAHAPRSEASDVYKWTDEKGVAHYADAPPEGRKYERVNVSSGATTTSAAEEDAAPAETAADRPGKPGRRHGPLHRRARPELHDRARQSRRVRAVRDPCRRTSTATAPRKS
jgi:hypothetical protein